MGLVQKAPFRMRGEPKWGTKHILQMNWVFDEFFVRIEVWDKVFRKFGIEKLPVVQHKTDKPLESVVQLKVLTTKRKKRTQSTLFGTSFAPVFRHGICANIFIGIPCN